MGAAIGKRIERWDRPKRGLHTIDRDDPYRATDVAKSAARKAFYNSINSALLRLGELPLILERERQGIESLNATLARGV
ncbi:MAG: hypothetical protein EPN30_02435 [Actinomycetota bacterium]|nr:MAG: hypothetical protein EPN30_02435 [Actinomycetota bacterium]